MEQKEVIVEGKGALREGNEATDIRAAARSVLLLVLEKHGNEELPLRLEDRLAIKLQVKRLVELEDSRLFICFYKIFSLVSHLNQRPQDKTENIEIAWTIFKSFWNKECWALIEIYLRKLKIRVQHPPINDQTNISPNKGSQILIEHKSLFDNLEGLIDEKQADADAPLVDDIDHKIAFFAREHEIDLAPIPSEQRVRNLNLSLHWENKVPDLDNQRYAKDQLVREPSQQAIAHTPKAGPISLPVATTIVSGWTMFVIGALLTVLPPQKKVTPANTRTTDIVPPHRILSVNSSPLVVDNPPPRNPSRTCSVKSITLINLAFRHDHRHMPPCDYDNNCKSTLIAALDSDRQNRTRLLFHCPTQTCTWSSTPTTDGSNVVISVTDANTGSGRHRHGSRRFHITVTTCGTITSTY